MIIDLMEEAGKDGCDDKLLELMEHFTAVQHPEANDAADDVLSLLVRLQHILGSNSWTVRTVPPLEHEHPEHFQITLTESGVEIDQFMAGTIDEEDISLDRSTWNYLLMWMADLPMSYDYLLTEVKEQFESDWELTGELIQVEYAFQIPLQRTS